MRRAILRRSCGAIAPLLWDYAAGALDASGPDAARVSAHLAGCARCRAEADAFRKAASALAASAATPPGGIPDRGGDWSVVHARIAARADGRTSEPAQRRWSRPLLLGGAAVAFAGAGICAFGVQSTYQADVARRDAARQSAETVAAAIDTGETRAGSTASDWRVRMLQRRDALPLDVDADGCFNNLRMSSGVFPIAVKLQNNTHQATTATISVSERITQAGSTWTRHVNLPAESVQRVFLYPSINGPVMNSSGGIAIEVLSSIGYRHLSVNPMFNWGEGSRSALIAEHGSLSPIAFPGSRSRNDPLFLSDAALTTPENAPDRAVGYRNGETQYLVLGRGAEGLNPAQWQAIRDWVAAGGALIVSGAATPDTLGRGVLPQPDERGLQVRWTDDNSPSPVGRCRFGAGVILYVPFDLTSADCRSSVGYIALWAGLRRLAQATIPVDIVQATAQAPGELSAADRIGQSSYSSQDPFRIVLPPLDMIVYVFVGYFLLAIPVTFVILRHTRRMNLAWITGPVLSFGVSGLLFGYTGNLRQALLSRRTTGVILAAAGDSRAQFFGTTELFFPKAGSYPIDVPGADHFQAGDKASSSAMRGLDVLDDGSGESIPRLDASNLSYRRLEYAQTASWGGGITADLAVDPRTSTITGVIHNRTGRTFSGAEIVLPPSQYATWERGGRAGRYKVEHTTLRWCEIGAVHSGANVIRGTILAGRYLPFGSVLSMQVAQRASGPMLVGRLSGESLGPKLGAWCGADDSVLAVVSLPPTRRVAWQDVSSHVLEDRNDQLNRADAFSHAHGGRP